MNLSKPRSSNHPPPSSSGFAVCHRHPGEPVTGFCAACLSERLAVLDPAGVKSVIETGQSSKVSCGGGAPELSRSKSCNHKRGQFVGVGVSIEPRRRSCDVRGRSSLSSLFGIDDADGDVGGGKGGGFADVDVGGVVSGKEAEVGIGEIRVSAEQAPVGGDGSEEWMTMKEHIDLECRSKKRVNKGKDLKNIAGSIWVAAASGLSKKLQKWRPKQKMRMPTDGNENNGVGAMNVRQWRERETQSEVGEYGFGRRSCDTDPRFSIDVGRASVDCPPRFSLDEQPRASWDGYLIGRSSAHRPNPMLAVVEDDDHHIDELINVNKNEIDKSPGGSEQTRDYYGEGLSRRRRSFDRSGSRRALSVEIDELRAISNARVSPATVELFHGAKVLFAKNDVKMPNLSPIKTDRVVRVESSDSASNGASSSIVGEGSDHNKVQVKKLAGWRKAWTNWGSSQKQVESKFKFACKEDEEEPKVADKVTGSSTHMSSSSSGSVSGSFMKSGNEAKGLGYLRNEQRQQLALERNRSSRYSPGPNNHENGLLRFYLTPLRGSRGAVKCSKSRLKSSQDIARNVLRL